MDASPVTWISEQHVKQLLTFNDLIPAVESALAQFSKHDKGVQQPVRTIMPIPDHRGFLGSMPVYMQETGCLAVKVVTFYRQGSPATHDAVILLFNPSDGMLRSIIAADGVSEMRTAAASAVATKYLAPTNSRVLAILGSGVHARAHFHALTSLMHFDQIRIWGRTPENAARCVEELGGPAVLCATAQDAVRDADVICTVTSSPEPVLMADWVKPGAHINGSGATRPTLNELQPELVRACDVYVDSRDGANQESGDIIKAKASIKAELGELVLGTHSADRHVTTFFKSLGVAVEDAAAAMVVYDKFRRMQEQDTPKD